MGGVSSGYISGTPSSLPSGWILASNYLVGPGANLQLAHLGADDLTNADLTSRVLRGAPPRHWRPLAPRRSLPSPPCRARRSPCASLAAGSMTPLPKPGGSC